MQVVVIRQADGFWLGRESLNTQLLETAVDIETQDAAGVIVEADGEKFVSRAAFRDLGQVHALDL